MWIEVLKTRCGMDGFYIKGEIREVDDIVLEKICNKKLGDNRLLFKEVPPPWDAQKDETAVQVAELQGRIGKVADDLERLEDELDEMQYRAGIGIGGAVGVLENAEHNYEQAEQCRKQLAAQAKKTAENAAKHPSEDNEKEAAELAVKLVDAERDEAEKSWLAQKAQAKLLLLNADIGLKELEAVDAHAEIIAMQMELYELRPDLEPKGDDDGPTEKTEGPDGNADGGTGGGGSQDDADAKGQTDAAGPPAPVPHEMNSE